MSGGRRDGRGRARGREVADGATPLLARGRESVLGCGALIPGVRDRRGAEAGLPEPEEFFQAAEDACEEGGDQGVQRVGQHSATCPRGGSGAPIGPGRCLW